MLYPQHLTSSTILMGPPWYFVPFTSLHRFFSSQGSQRHSHPTLPLLSLLRSSTPTIPQASSSMLLSQIIPTLSKVWRLLRAPNDSLGLKVSLIVCNESASDIVVVMCKRMMVRWRKSVSRFSQINENISWVGWIMKSNAERKDCKDRNGETQAAKALKVEEDVWRKYIHQLGIGCWAYGSGLVELRMS